MYLNLYSLDSSFCCKTPLLSLSKRHQSETDGAATPPLALSLNETPSSLSTQILGFPFKQLGFLTVITVHYESKSNLYSKDHEIAGSLRTIPRLLLRHRALLNLTPSLTPFYFSPQTLKSNSFSFAMGESFPRSFMRAVSPREERAGEVRELSQWDESNPYEGWFCMGSFNGKQRHRRQSPRSVRKKKMEF